MFLKVPLSIIRNFHCTHSNDICHTGLLHVSDSPPFHHQEFFTVHTAMVYAIQVC